MSRKSHPVIEQKADLDWRSEHDRKHIRDTLATYVYPKIGDTPIRRITIEHVLDLLTEKVAVKGKPHPVPFSRPRRAPRQAKRTRYFMSRVSEYGGWRGVHEPDPFPLAGEGVPLKPVCAPSVTFAGRDPFRRGSASVSVCRRHSA